MRYLVSVYVTVIAVSDSKSLESLSASRVIDGDELARMKVTRVTAAKLKLGSLFEGVLNKTAEKL
jgi:hypothetical protein